LSFSIVDEHLMPQHATLKIVLARPLMALFINEFALQPCGDYRRVPHFRASGQCHHLQMTNVIRRTRRNEAVITSAVITIDVPGV
jgi:hypothetical protein